MTCRGSQGECFSRRLLFPSKFRTHDELETNFVVGTSCASLPVDLLGGPVTVRGAIHDMLALLSPRRQERRQRTVRPLVAIQWLARRQLPQLL
jgi:hypothetical protein